MTFHTSMATPKATCGIHRLNGIAYGLVQPSGPVVVEKKAPWTKMGSWSRFMGSEIRASVS